MRHPTRGKTRKPRVADEIMAGMRELERMMDQGRLPEELFTVKTIEVPDPAVYRPAQIRALRGSLGVSQAVFASLMGVSVVLVKFWNMAIGSRA